MKTIIEAPNDGVLSLGRQGENLARRVKFKLPPNWDMSDPAASVQLVVQRAGESAAYPVMLTREDGVYYWDVTATDTGRDGYGLCELRYLLGDVLAKSMTWITSVAESINDDMTEPPDAAQNYLSQVMAEGAKATSAADRAESAVLKMPYIENGVWMVWDFEQQAYVNTGVSAGGSGEGTPGAVFVPHVDVDGNLSWTNDGGLDNPETVNIMGPPGEGTPGGYYTPTVSQPDANTMRVSYTPSQEGMPAAEQVNVVLPQGRPGSNGKTAYQYAQDGGYTGSETEFSAKLAAEHLPVPAIAAVGQYFKAKTVDGNGLVTEVEAVDAPTGGGGETWELINSKIFGDGEEEATKLLFDKDENENPFFLKKALLLYYYPKYAGSTEIPGYTFAILNGFVTGNKAPMVYTSGVDNPNASGTRNGAWLVEVLAKGVLTRETTLKTTASGSNNSFGTNNANVKSFYGLGEKARDEITSIGFQNSVLFPGCEIYLFGVRDE